MDKRGGGLTPAEKPNRMAVYNVLRQVHRNDLQPLFLKHEAWFTEEERMAFDTLLNVLYWCEGEFVRGNNQE